MWIRLVVGLGVYEAAMISLGLFQSQIVPDSAVMRIFEDFPIFGLFIFTLYYVQKQQREDNRQNREWLEHMLDLQRSNLNKTHEGQNTFLSTVITQIETKQNDMANRVELLAQQIAINTSTVNEIAKVDSIVAESEAEANILFASDTKGRKLALGFILEVHTAEMKLLQTLTLELLREARK